MKTLQSTTWSWSWILLVTLVVAVAPNTDVLAQSCCDSADETSQTADTASGPDQSAVQTCSAHGDLGLPDSSTGRMVHAFIDLTYTSGEDALQAFLEKNLAPMSRERNGDESLLEALRTLRADLPKSEVKSAAKTGAYSAQFVVNSNETGAVATLDFELEAKPPHRIDRFSAQLGENGGGSCGASTVAEDDPEIADVELPAVGLSLDLLRQRFNADSDKLRIVALLSPTCEGCLRGARAIQQSVLDRYPDLDTAVHVVWLPMLGSDNEASAKKSSLMYTDSRVRQYWDAEKSSGWAYTNDLFSDMGERMKTAIAGDEQLQRDVQPRGQGPMWDIYMLYEPGAKWGETVPEPTSWVMQMIPGYTLVWKNDFANPPLRSELVDEIAVLMQEVLGEDPELRAESR